jgi:hypothetical protein
MRRAPVALRALAGNYVLWMALSALDVATTVFTTPPSTLSARLWALQTRALAMCW